MSFFQSCRWCGIAPYNLLRDKENQIVDYKLNRFLCLFSLLLLFAFCASIHSTIVCECLSSDPIRLVEQIVLNR